MNQNLDPGFIRRCTCGALLHFLNLEETVVCVCGERNRLAIPQTVAHANDKEVTKPFGG